MSLVPKIKYLTNKDLLSAINDSKATFCEFTDKKYRIFDIIVDNLASVTDEMIHAARLKRLSTMTLDEKKKYGKTHETSLSINDILPEDIVVRLMTYEHIPLDPDKLESKIKTPQERYIRVNFPPFQHYIKSNNKWVCVGKSHTKNGEFSLTHGKVTNHLAAMWMKLVERYGHRGNWRGYCVSEDTQALTKRGWLNYDEITTDDIILSYDMESKQHKWSKIKYIFRDQYVGKMFHMSVTGLDALVTPGHKWVTQNGLKKVEHLLEKDQLILCGNAVEDSSDFVKTYSDEFVELMGWVVTAGNFYYRNNSCRVTIYQNEGQKADRIRNCLKTLNFKFSEFTRNRQIANYPQVTFTLSKAASNEICKLTDKKTLNMEFILSLSQQQRELLIETMVSGDGWIRKQSMSYSQKDKDHMDMFLVLCTLSGYRASCQKREFVTKKDIATHIYTANIFSKRRNNSNVENIDFHGAKRNGKHNGTVGKGKEHHPNEPTVDYNGMVWCPQTEYGTFVARRNGCVYITSNSYLDEMRSQALVQLSQVGLQFDESKSSNPFAYYSQVCSTSFLKILNLEKRSQHIRDDLLIMHGNTPSHTRQVEDQLSQQQNHTDSDTTQSPTKDE